MKCHTNSRLIQVLSPERKIEGRRTEKNDDDADKVDREIFEMVKKEGIFN